MNADRLHEAKAAHGRGWAQTPLNGKTPILKAWTTAPAPTLDEVRSWASAGNVGIRTGAISGIVVIDVDAAKGGDEASLNLPATPTVLTGGGGMHLYFRANVTRIGNSASKLGSHIDVRGDGGQVVAAGSVHPVTGAIYKWAPGLSPDDLPLADLPAHIVERLAPKPKPPKAPRPVNYVSDAYARKAMEREIEAVRTAPKKTGNDQLNRSAFALGQLVGAGLLIEADVREALFDAATPRRPEDEARKTIQSGIEDGMREPRKIVRREGPR